MNESTSELTVRAASEDDIDRLSAFRCSTGPWYEEEVENYVRSHAAHEAFAGPTNYRLLLVLDDDRLIGCAAHYPEGLLVQDSTLILATHLQLAAISITDQGRKLKDGKKLSELLMTATIRDALEQPWASEVVTGLVARDNVRSAAICERAGLRSQTRYNRRYIRFSGKFEKQ